MAGITPFRLVVALLTTIGTGIAVYALGAPPFAAMLAVAGGLAGGIVLMWKASADDEPEIEDTGDRAVLRDESPPGATLEELMDAIDDPSLLVVERRIVRANPAALELLGNHIVGEDIRLAIRHPAAAERLTGDTRNGGREDGDRTSIELVGIGERERPWELVIHELSGDARFVRLADRSRTHAAEKMRVDFVANASHELRTPLASLLGYIETLQDGAVREKKTRKRFLEIMHGEASRMQRLIGDLMSLSRIEAEKFRKPDEEILIGPLVTEACATACSVLNQDQGRITIHGSKTVQTIMGDRAQIGQLIGNLVGNALKYGREDGPVTVTYRALSDTMMRLTVEDEGDGIPADQIPRLTERFYRVDPSRSRSMGGTGLGLAIVKHIVERHRGRLDIRSIEGKGTTVIVGLPKNPSTMSSPRNENVTQGDPERVAISRDSI